MSDELFDQEIAKVQARNRELASYLDTLASQAEADNRRAAYLSHLYDENERLEREIAALEGRPNHDEADPYSTEAPPEPPKAAI